ncbi:MAG: Rrf2 family transcriptional regulator [bacterium]
MKFTTKGDYGLALMIGLARQHGSGSISLRELATNEQIPYAYAEQLIARLKRAKLLKSLRGMKGGYALTKAPNQITVQEILRALEDHGLVPCQREGKSCPKQEGCTTHNVWEVLQETLDKKMHEIKLVDLINN